MSFKTVESVCTYCGVGCEISAQIENGKIKKILPNKNGKAGGGNICIKGKYGWEFLNSAKRLGEVKIKKDFFIKNFHLFPKEIKQEIGVPEFVDGYYYPQLELSYKIAAWKFSQIKDDFTGFAHASIGGARTSCESGFIFQKFTREVLGSPNIDNCARVCHAPSLKGMRLTIGEGAATNPYDDIKEAGFLLVVGSNTTEAHPMIATRILEAKKRGAKIAVIDVRKIKLCDFADLNAIIPFETNLLVLNMISYVIITEELYDKNFIKNRTEWFEEYKNEILNDPFANPDFFLGVKGYEELPKIISQIARAYASNKSMIVWGLGVTEHIDGSYAVCAICNLALLSGNIGKMGAGLMPLRGQNNVQGACDMGCLPYYLPDYDHPQVEGLKTPDVIKKIQSQEIKSLYVMGEDIAHIHANQNKIHSALENLEFLVVNELFDNEITKFADIVFGVKSGYEKTGVYVNAERRLHLSSPLQESSLPDDWEVISKIAKYMGANFEYQTSENIWNEVMASAKKRFAGASYERLIQSGTQGLQWPVSLEGMQTPVLHAKTFRTKDGFGQFRYKKWQKRGMIIELINNIKNKSSFYLTTGRALHHYNNGAQTKECSKLIDKIDEDILLVNQEDFENFKEERIGLISAAGESGKLKFKVHSGIKKGTMFATFHFASSKINFLFGDEADELTKTAAFKSVKVEIK